MTTNLRLARDDTPDAHRPRADGPRPAPDQRDGPTALLIGTALSVRQLRHALDAADRPPRVIGCLLTARRTDAADAGPCPVLGELADLEDAVHAHRPDLVLVCLPVAMARQGEDVARRLDRLGATWRAMPTLSDQLAGRISTRGTVSDGVATSFTRSGGPPGGAAVDPTLLIPRRPHDLDESAIRRCLRGRVVLVSGAGGSIGSELVRMIGRFEPDRLVLVERSENALFEIDRELGRVFPDVPRSAELHDVTLAPATRELVARHRPAVVFHAAAHKHVPMMEDHPAAAVENNFYGTRALADAADRAGCDRFVMISTDKAVNPTSVMGASKRLAELYIQHLNRRSETVFSVVRFGNVLGSACSVLPIWTSQLALGGPITVTHPDMRRYFMTIPEAAGLVLQAGSFDPGDAHDVTPAKPGNATGRADHPHADARGGEVFLLDMGQPIRIVDLAERFLRVHGFEPNVDVAIRFTGVRPGEKLYEELAYDSEDVLPTPHEAIRIWRTAPPDPSHMQQVIATFDRLRGRGGEAAHPWQGVSREAIVNALRHAVPEMLHAVAG